MRSLGEIPVALEGCYSSMEALCADLGEAELAGPIPLPGLEGP